MFLEIILHNFHLVFAFLIIAILFSSIGFGGGSSYLAVLAFAGIIYTQVRSTSLLCNVVVVLGNIYFYINQKQYDWKKTLSLVSLSVPMAFLGGYIEINERVFFILLGFVLIIASSTMWFVKPNSNKNRINKNSNTYKNIFYGGFIGFISGMVGIGGGIFLAPLLYITNWDTPKKIAAASSFFILVNSISGLTGQFTNSEFSIDWNLTSILLITVFIGGQIGSRISFKFFNPIQLKKITAILIAFVSIRILIKYLF